MTSLPMNSVLNSLLFLSGEQSLDCLSAVVFWKVFMEYNISGNFPGFQIIIQLPFYGASQGSCILAWCIGRREDNMGPQSIILKDDVAQMARRAEGQRFESVNLHHLN